MVGEEWPEARARFDARVPFLGAVMLLPGHVAEIIDGREVRRSGDVGEAETIAGEIAAALHEIGDVVEMVLDVLAAGADRLAIGLAEAEKALHDLFLDQIDRHLAVELDVEPGDEAARLGALDRSGADEGPFGIDLLEIFGDG